MLTITEALRLRGIGAGGALALTDKQALIDIVNAAEANNDALKNDVVAKLKNFNPALSISSASTWTEIRAAIASMQNRGAVTITPSTVDQVIMAGYHNGAGKVLGDLDLIAANIKAGVNIFGVNGKPEVVDTTTAVGAAIGDVLSGKDAFVNGVKRVGTMTNNGIVNQTIATQNGQLSLNGYYSTGSMITASFPNLVAGNIKSGVNIGGVVGNFNPTARTFRKVCSPTEYNQVFNINPGFNIGIFVLNYEYYSNNYYYGVYNFVKGTFEMPLAGNHSPQYANITSSSFDLIVSPPGGTYYVNILERM
ncbi:hypothetical protein NV379_23330 [Paenibacillus sp. N1-5-1-14]|uniref:hypothetical protein n=1 Tax=Paenibacillus radicibacter TaxID=2972488 RepID=UPI0021594D6C|nr:hypothetical protein [Paenibacillus radicibacter]MCR8645575.1 hypothetical protein [Paenibacillus radicibacter]